MPVQFNLLFKKIALWCIVWHLFPLVTYAQNFGDEKFYLIDSLNLEKLSLSERNYIDSSLIVYHSTDNDTLQFHIINAIINNSWNDFVWPSYSQWVYSNIPKKTQ